MSEKTKSENIVKKMLAKDEFSNWMGIEVIEVKPGYSKLKMKIRKEMMNGFDICHGGVIFSLADSALAFASNSFGNVAVAIDTSVSFTAKVFEGDVLLAEAVEQSRNFKTAVYNVSVKNQNDEAVAVFKGTVYITKKELIAHR